MLKTVGDIVKTLNRLDQDKEIEFVYVDSKFRDTIYEFHNVLLDTKNDKIAIMIK